MLVHEPREDVDEESEGASIGAIGDGGKRPSAGEVGGALSPCVIVK